MNMFQLNPRIICRIIRLSYNEALDENGFPIQGRAALSNLTQKQCGDNTPSPTAYPSPGKVNTRVDLAGRQFD